MNKKLFFGLFILGLCSGIAITWLRPFTGYMDADYYYAGAKTLFEGKGFQDYYLWNYLSNPTALPTPSHTYWMPMASLISLAGMKLFGNSNLLAARFGFIVLFAFLPPMMANLSWKTFQRRDFAILSGVYTILCGYFIKFVTEPDGFVVLFLCGILMIHMLQAYQKAQSSTLILGFGFLVGLIHLSRSDGILWLFLVGGYLLFSARLKTWKAILSTLLLFLGGYLLVTGGWYLRIWQATRIPFPSGGLKTVFLTSYDELFTYPASALSLSSWFQQGWLRILSPRLTALGLNSLSLLAVFGSIILVPSLVFAIRKFWSSRITRFLLLTGGCVFIIMTFAVPFVGMRGGLLHSGAIFMPAIWLVAPVGNMMVVDKIRSSTRYHQFSEKFYHALTIVILVLMTGTILAMDRVLPNSFTQADTWNQYKQASEWLNQQYGNDPIRTVMINNPPAYYAATGERAIVIPYGTTETIIQAAQQFNADFLFLDENYRSWFPSLFQENVQSDARFIYLGEVNGLLLFQLEVTK